jgi:hypothetical protein
MKFSLHEPVAVVSLGMEAANVLLFFAWMLWATEAAVRRGADLYAARLFETLDSLPRPTRVVGFRN